MMRTLVGVAIAKERITLLISFSFPRGYSRLVMKELVGRRGIYEAS